MKLLISCNFRVSRFYNFRIFLLLLCGLIPFAAGAQKDDSIVSRIVLIGDAGALAPDKHHPVVEAVEKLIKLDKKTTVVYLGDNLYRHGLPDDAVAAYAQGKAVLDSQANLANHSRGMVYMIPGNHDWKNGAPDGFQAILREGRYINGLGKKNLKFLPEDGCPGPEEVDLGDDVVMIIMDSQWWLQRGDKPGIESGCKYKTEEEVLADIRDIVTRNYKKLIIFACHHPFMSNGTHGGYYNLKQHIFPFTDIRQNLYIPLPVLGSLYPISRGVFGTPEDLHYPAYANMISRIDDILKGHPHVIHVAGHEHALQWIADSNNNYICSGSGCKTTRISKSRRTKFVAQSIGFATLEVYKNKDVRCTFYGASPDSLHALYSGLVFNYGKLPPQPKEDTTIPVALYKDTANVPASTKYEHPTMLRRAIMGENYRREWSQPVNFPVFHINTEMGGFKITGAGGGYQTKTLHLEDKKGRQWNLRTIDKDPQRALPPNFRASFAKALIQDVISAAHPYAPLTVSALAGAGGVIEAKPTFFVVPDDPALGFYRPLFSNKVCLLEAQDAAPDGTDTKSTEKIIRKMLGDNDHFVDQHAVLRARLLDMLIGDWDRHFGQWHWGVADTGRGKLYYPIPRDRDQAFFLSTGLLFKFITTSTLLPWMKGFHKDFHAFRWLGRSARDFDRFFLNELDGDDWRSAIHQFQVSETDTVIACAVREMPPAIAAISGDEIALKLRSRRDELGDKGMSYYRFLSRRVTITGSNRSEYFTVRQNDSGVLVQVHAKDPDNDTSLLMYSRIFNPKVTKEIRLYGLNGNDVFYVDSSVHTGMRIRMIGGHGNDTFRVAGRARSAVYDVSTEPNPVLEARHASIDFSEDPHVNDYSINQYQYNVLSYPLLNAGYNAEDGILIGSGISYKHNSFRRLPYGSFQVFNFLFAPTHPSYAARYGGDFNHVFNKLDIVARSEFEAPTLRNFVGLGNETKITHDPDFYRVRYGYINGDLLLRKRLFGILSIAAGPMTLYYWNHRSTNTRHVLEAPEQIGLDSNDIFKRKMYLGGKLTVDVNNLNNPLFPTRGVQWHNELVAMGGLNQDTHPITEALSDLNVYASLSDPAKLVAVLRFGGGHIFSKQYEFFQALSIGEGNVLRGFRKDRFSGSSIAYNSIELRAKIATVKSYILPGDFGALAFNDVARVWVPGEHSNLWHDAYGAGLYYIPFNTFLISGALAFSTEETLFSITIGARFNLTF